MCYLHHGAPISLVHRDLKSANGKKPLGIHFQLVSVWAIVGLAVATAAAAAA